MSRRLPQPNLHYTNIIMGTCSSYFSEKYCQTILFFFLLRSLFTDIIVTRAKNLNLNLMNIHQLTKKKIVYIFFCTFRSRWCHVLKLPHFVSTAGITFSEFQLSVMHNLFYACQEHGFIFSISTGRWVWHAAATRKEWWQERPYLGGSSLKVFVLWDLAQSFAAQNPWSVLSDLSLRGTKETRDYKCVVSKDNQKVTRKKKTARCIILLFVSKDSFYVLSNENLVLSVIGTNTRGLCWHHIGSHYERPCCCMHTFCSIYFAPPNWFHLARTSRNDHRYDPTTSHGSHAYFVSP